MKAMKKAQGGASVKIKVKAKPLPKAGNQTPADFLPGSYDKLPRTKSGGANYNGPKVGPREKTVGGMSRNGSKLKKAKVGGEFGALSVKAGVDDNYGITAADRIAGATMKNKAKHGVSMKKAMMGTSMMNTPMMKKGGAMKKCKYGCK